MLLIFDSMNTIYESGEIDTNQRCIINSMNSNFSTLVKTPIQ